MGIRHSKPVIQVAVIGAPAGGGTAIIASRNFIAGFLAIGAGRFSLGNIRATLIQSPSIKNSIIQ
jgi:hypothetical protein